MQHTWMSGLVQHNYRRVLEVVEHCIIQMVIRESKRASGQEGRRREREGETKRQEEAGREKDE